MQDFYLSTSAFFSLHWGTRTVSFRILETNRGRGLTRITMIRSIKSIGIALQLVILFPIEVFTYQTPS